MEDFYKLGRWRETEVSVVGTDVVIVDDERCDDYPEYEDVT